MWNNPVHQYRLTADNLGCSSAESNLRSYWTTSWAWASNVPLQQRRPTVHLVALVRVEPAG